MLDASAPGSSFNSIHPGVHPAVLHQARVNGSVQGRLNTLEPTPANLNVKRNEGSSGGDRVELSDRAQLLERLRQMPAVRADLVQKIRTSINKGNYETPQRINTAIAALLEDLRGNLPA